MSTIDRVQNTKEGGLSGQRFGKWTVLDAVELSPAGERRWLCRCDCGNELDISYNELVYSDIQSCGCKKKEHDEALHTLLTHVAGTSLDAIRSSKVPKSNSTGYRGVYLVKGKYLAKIVFQKKQYVLGSYDNIEDAAAARKEAEKLLFEDTVSFYEKWKAKSEQDPEWAEKNPVSIDVYRTDSGRLSVAYQPAL